jgi:hypothetical protein
MMDATHKTLEVLEELHGPFGWQPEWTDRLAAIPAWHPRMEGEEGAGGGEAGGEAGGEGAAGGEAAGGGEAAAGAGGGEAAGSLSGELAGGGEEQGGGAAGVDLETLMGAFDGFRTDVTQRLDALPRQAAAAPAAAEDDEDDPFSPDRFTLNDFDEEGNLKPQAQSRAIKDLVQNAVNEAMAPERERAQRERINSQAAALEERYPDLQDREKRTAILNSAKGRAANLARVTGRSELAELWREPDFLETVYLADAARAAAASQTPAAQQTGVHLEAGGAAGPAGNQGGTAEDQLGDAIVGVAQSRRFRLGTGVG